MDSRVVKLEGILVVKRLAHVPGFVPVRLKRLARDKCQALTAARSYAAGRPHAREPTFCQDRVGQGSYYYLPLHELASVARDLKDFHVSLFGSVQKRNCAMNHFELSNLVKPDLALPQPLRQATLSQSVTNGHIAIMRERLDRCCILPSPVSSKAGDVGEG